MRPRSTVALAAQRMVSKSSTSLFLLAKVVELMDRSDDMFTFDANEANVGELVRQVRFSFGSRHVGLDLCSDLPQKAALGLCFLDEDIFREQRRRSIFVSVQCDEGHFGLSKCQYSLSCSVVSLILTIDVKVW